MALVLCAKTLKDGYASSPDRLPGHTIIHWCGLPKNHRGKHLCVGCGQEWHNEAPKKTVSSRRSYSTRKD